MSLEICLQHLITRHFKLFEDIAVELTNTVFVNSTNTSTNIETVMLSTDNLVKLKELKLTSDKTFLRTRLV